MTKRQPVILDQYGRKMTPRDIRKLQNSYGNGFKGANDSNLQDWAVAPLEINDILRNDLAKLRARSRDLARNDDTAKRFLYLIKQNVLGHTGIRLQAKNKDSNGVLDDGWNNEIETEWQLFGQKRRINGQFESPSTCGQFTLREIAWLGLWSKVIDGECFIHVMRGYPHNRNRFAMRFLNPDLLDSGFCETPKNGNRVEMGIEFDNFDRPVAYHFNEDAQQKRRNSKTRRIRIPASQIIHIFRHEYVGQIRGIPDFAGIMHKTKMLNGVHEAIVVGWRVAAAKMGFMIPREPEEKFDTGEQNAAGKMVMDVVPGSIETLQDGYDFETFDPDYPTSTYESGNRVFMQQLSNGLNVSSPTLSNDYSKVNYSSLRQALLEDREGWRCIQAEMIDDFYQPLFDDWYDWALNVTGLINVDESKRGTYPVIEWQPRGWAWVDPLKEVRAQVEAVSANLRTRQSVIAETTGADFMDTADTLETEKQALEDRGLYAVPAGMVEETEEDNEDG